MKIKTNKKELFHKLLLAKKITEKNRSVNEYLYNILLEAGDEIFIKSTNLAHISISKINGVIIEKGTVAVNGILFYNLIASFKNDEEIYLFTENSQLNIMTNGNKYKLTSVNKEYLPEMIEDLADVSFFDIDNKLLINSLERVKYAFDEKNLNPMLTVINFSINNKILNLYATCGFLLSTLKTSVETTGNFSNISLGSNNIEMINFFNKISEGPFKIGHKEDDSRNILILRNKNMTLIIYVTNYGIANYTKVLPDLKKYEKFLIEKESFLISLKRLLLFENNFDINGIMLIKEKHSNIITLKLESKSKGKAVEDLQLIKPNNLSFSVVLNGYYLRKIISNFSTKIVEFYINLQKNNTPLVLLEEENPDYINLIMRLQEK